jgi:hypothetical protein
VFAMGVERMGHALVTHGNSMIAVGGMGPTYALIPLTPHPSSHTSLPSLRPFFAPCSSASRCPSPPPQFPRTHAHPFHCLCGLCRRLHPLSVFLVLSLSLTLHHHTHIPSPSPSPSCSVAVAYTTPPLPPTHTHTHTHTLSLSLSLSRTHTRVHGCTGRGGAGTTRFTAWRGATCRRGSGARCQPAW